MRLFKKFTGFLGLAKDDQNQDSNFTLPPFSNNPKGFSVPVQLPVNRRPIIALSASNQGGVQGLRWFARCLKIDEEGDVADEFFEEVLPGTQWTMEVDHMPVRNIEVKYIVRPAKVRNQVISPEGKLQHCVENQGRLQWV